MFTVQITDLAQSDIQEAFDWWAENRSHSQAVKWYEQIVNAIGTLVEKPERCPLVAETDLARQGVRQLFFGVGTRATHRIVFSINLAKKSVTILRVRHHAQSDI